MRAANSGISLDDADAALVKGMLDRGDRQHDIAAWFGVNGGRIAEISTGHTFEHVAAQKNNLPPPGPYASGKATEDAKRELISIKARLEVMVNEIDQQIKKLDR